MNFGTIKPDEIRLMYEQSADKRLQITIMADLMACEEADVCDMLGIPHTKKRARRVIDEVEALEMHRNGATDYEIASEFGVTKDAVKAWKWRSGLMELSEETKSKYAQCRVFYDQGMNDVEIAMATGLKRKSVCDWRKQNKLPANKMRNWRDWENDDERFMPLYEQGMNDGEIADVFGLNPWNVRDWRQYRGLKHNRPAKSVKCGRKRKDWTEVDRRFRPLYEQGLNDPQIAKITFSDKRSVCAWRNRFNLPAHGRKKK